MELYEQIRREFEHGAGAVRGVSRKLGVRRQEVRQALVSAVPAERKVPERERPKLSAAIPFIDEILESDCKAPRKQRHTAPRSGPGSSRPTCSFRQDQNGETTQGATCDASSAY